MALHLHALAALATCLPTLLPAQESARTVAPGRDFRESKLLSPGLTDVWDLQVDQDEMVHCVVESAAFDPVLELVDEDEERLGLHDGEGTRSELWLRMPKKGAVQFRVRPYQGSGGGQYSFFLHRFRTTHTGPTDAAVGRFDKSQWHHHRISLTRGDVLIPTVTGHGRLTQVLDAARHPLPPVHGGYRAPQDGDYFVRIEGPRDHGYRLATQLARQRDHGGPQDASGSSLVEATIPPHGFDIWRVPVKAGVSFALDVRMPDTALTVELMDPDRDRHGPRIIRPGRLDKGGTVLRYFLARRDSHLELRLRNASSSPARYRLAVPELKRELEPGTDTRDSLPLGAGHLYCLHLDAGQLLKLQLNSESFDAFLDIWRPDGIVVAHADDRDLLSRDAEHTMLIDRPGTWRVLVHSPGGAGSGSYRLRAETLPVPMLALGESLDLELAAAGETQIHLDLQAGEVAWLAVESTAFDAALQVMDPTGDGSFVREGGGVGNDVLTAYRATHAGRHTLRVFARSGSGTGAVRAVRPLRGADSGDG